MKSTWILSISFLAFLYACQPNCEDNCEPVTGTVDPVNDLVGYLDPTTGPDDMGTLYFRPGYREGIIERLGANLIDDGIYRMQIKDVNGFFSEHVFSAVETQTPFYFVRDSEPEELKSKYKIYRDAECKQTLTPLTDSCRAVGDEYWTSVYPIGWNQCEKGTGLCVEIERVLATHYHYEDSECTILVDVSTSKNSHCDL